MHSLRKWLSRLVPALLLTACDPNVRQQNATNGAAATAERAMPPAPIVRTDIKGIEIGMSPSDVRRLHANCEELRFANDMPESSPSLRCPADDGEVTVHFTSPLSGERAYSVSYCFVSDLYLHQLAESVTQQYRLPYGGADQGDEWIWDIGGGRQLSVSTYPFVCGTHQPYMFGRGEEIKRLGISDPQLANADRDAILSARTEADEARREAATPPPNF